MNFKLTELGALLAAQHFILKYPEEEEIHEKLREFVDLSYEKSFSMVSEPNFLLVMEVLKVLFDGNIKLGFYPDSSFYFYHFYLPSMYNIGNSAKTPLTS